MEDREFSPLTAEYSPPKAEYAPLREEFTPPRAEFAPPEQEHRSDGREYEQKTEPPEKRERKRRVNPLMATAAAVTATVVTVSGLTVAPAPPAVDDESSRRVWCKLDAPHYAYLEDLSGAMQARDIDLMQELAVDTRLRTLIEDDLMTFYEEIGRWDELVVLEETAEAEAGDAPAPPTFGSGFFSGRFSV